MSGGLRAGACLSLSGRFAPFGRHAEQGLRLWAAEFGVDLAVVDDESDPVKLGERLPAAASGVDLLFGPYSTLLARAAAAFAQNHGMLLFNHGGSGGRLNMAGQVVNVLTPAHRYAAPFIAHLAQSGSGRLFTYSETGLFGQQVTAGARGDARAAGIAVDVLDFDAPPDGPWNLFSAGVYEDDVDAVRRAQELSNPPQLICSVAAGVEAFADDVQSPDGIYGVGQWAPGMGASVDVGVTGPEFLATWRERFGGVPDYPGVQAYAAGAIASSAVRTAGTAEPGALWRAASELDVRTVFGRFRLDPATGEQVGHESVLTLWRGSDHTLAP